jgi:hypothetical protein
MKIFWTLLISLCAPVLIAQPTLTKDLVGVIGANFGTLVAEEMVDPGPDGANVIWDYSFVTPDDTVPAVIIEYIDPFDTPYAVDFPNANIASKLVGISNFWNYFELTDQAFISWGSVFEAGPTTSYLRYSDPWVNIEFPFTYGSSFSDDFAGTTGVAGFENEFAGAETTTGDAWGTIILPNAAYNDVLRIRSDLTRTDSTDLMGIVNKRFTQTTNYFWYSGSVVSSVASLDISTGYNVTILNGVQIGDTSFFNTNTFTYNQLLVSGVDEKEKDPFELTVFPNPTLEQFQISYTLPVPQEVLVTMYNLNGKEVLKRQVNGYAGGNKLQLDECLPAGVYVLRVLGEMGVASEAVVVE